MKPSKTAYFELSKSDLEMAQTSEQCCMKSIYTELAVYGSKNLCARTENFFSPISEVCNGTVSLHSFAKSPSLYYNLYLVCIFLGLRV